MYILVEDERRPLPGPISNFFVANSVQALSTPITAPSVARTGPLNEQPFASPRMMTVVRMPVPAPLNQMPPSSPLHSGSCRIGLRKLMIELSSPPFTHSVKSNFNPAAPT